MSQARLTLTRDAVRAAFADFIDYAGLFPPASLSMNEAIREYDEARNASHAWMLGRFIVPVSRLPELLEGFGEREPFDLSVIVDASPDPRAWFDDVLMKSRELATVRARSLSVLVRAVELPLPRLTSRRETYDATIGQGATLLDNAAMRDLPCYLEMPRNERWSELLAGTLSALARARLRSKIRCGGATEQAFPSPGDLADFVALTTSEHVAFKATAGLHHPIRHRDAASGFMMHGFLNLLAAAVLAGIGVSRDELESVLADENANDFQLDDAGLRWIDRRASAAEIERSRTETFVGYGSCSFSEPVEDLTAMGAI
jgi:hypothetical protein